MKHLNKALSLTLAITAGYGATSIHAQEIDNRANVYGGLTHFNLDSERSLKSDEGYMLGGELPFGERWSGTIEHWQTESEFKNNINNAELRYDRIGLNYHLNNIKSWQPYLSTGFGKFNTRPEFSLLTKTENEALDFGVGVKRAFTNNFFMRADAKVLMGVNGTSTKDYLVGLALGYSFGKKTFAVASSPKVAEPVVFSDVDADGVKDSQDNCANTPRGAKVDSKGCQLDGDRDGVVDGKDDCPATPADVAVNVRGCPLTDVVELRKKLEVKFDTNTAIIKPQFEATIREFATFMKSHDKVHVVIEGHTDSDGAAAYNQRLSEQRATAVMNRLVNQYGIPQANISAKGFGESRPLTSNETVEGKRTNRRIVANIMVTETVMRKRQQ